MSQELNLIEREENYVNPFKEKEILEVLLFLLSSGVFLDTMSINIFLLINVKMPTIIYNLSAR